MNPESSGGLINTTKCGMVLIPYKVCLDKQREVVMERTNEAIELAVIGRFGEKAETRIDPCGNLIVGRAGTDLRAGIGWDDEDADWVNATLWDGDGECSSYSWNVADHDGSVEAMVGEEILPWIASWLTGGENEEAGK